MKEPCVALLGRRDEPTDAVEEYCHYLGAALEAQGISLEFERLPWRELGWKRALAGMDRRAGNRKNEWVLIQYTALAWSRRGFPLRLLGLLRFLRKYGVRCGVVFHDAEPYEGSRLVDHVRRQLQTHTMREAVRLADLGILTVPQEKARWLPASAQNVVFIPVGANLPSPERAWSQAPILEGQPPRVAIFSLSPGRAGEEEVQTIAEATSYAARKVSGLCLVMLGRNSEAGAILLTKKLVGAPVQIDVRGLLPADEIVRVLASCNVMLFVRGPISSRRGSAIAGIACGLPIVAQEGWETGWPITEAGVVLVPEASKEGFGPALLRVLSDKSYRALLAARSRTAQDRYFSWRAIADQYAQVLRKNERNP